MASGHSPQKNSIEAIPRRQLEDMPRELADALRPRVERLGYLGEFFQYAANQPQALLAFVEFSERAKADLPPRIVELIALTVATLAGNDYERHQHEQLSLRLGMTADWIRAVQRTDSSGLTEDDERAVHSYLLAAFPTGIGATRQLARVA